MSDPTLLDSILAPGGLRPCFQPILEVGSTAGPQVHGLECLMRGPEGTNVEDAEVLFDYVRRKREESLVDRACVATALGVAQGLAGSPRLSLNIHASTLGRDQQFLDFLEDTADRCNVKMDRLTVEIVEHSPSWDGPSFARALDELRKLGVGIALDDIGLGESNYRMILDCRPDYFKLDRYFVQNSHADFSRQAVIESVAMLARSFGARVVAEGVEERAELELIRSLGVELAQGHLFSRAVPAAEWPEVEASLDGMKHDLES